ncbi:MAG: hypothetical protein WCC14_07455 [Acidobacteriaceae bacterium]
MSATADLFGVTPENASEFYRKLCLPEEFPRGRVVREHCERLWAIYAPFAEPQFLAEFPIRFHQRWFEMYLTATLIERGVKVQPTSPPGPDVLVQVGGRRIWIEAVCATGGEPGLPDSVVHMSCGHVPWDQIALRIRNSIEEKRNKYAKYLEKGLLKPGEPLLIALNVEQIPYASFDSPKYIFRALYGVGNQVIHLQLPKGGPPKAVGTSNEQLLTINKRSSGAPVGTQPFIDGSMPTITGVIVSGHNSGSAAHRPPDFTLYPNLTAETPWVAGELPVSEWQFRQSDEAWQGQLTEAGEGSTSEE